MTNDSNANTSGSSVANVGYLPQGLLEKLSAAAGIVWKNLVKVVKGEATLATVDYAVKSGSDLLPDLTMDEIARRLIVTLELKAQGNVVFAPTPPDDHSKVWWQIDPVTGIPLGSPKVFNSTSGMWEDVQTVASAYVPPQRRALTAFADAGQSQATLNFETLRTTNYAISITATTFINGSWQAAPSSYPTHTGVVVTNRGEAELTVNFYGTPTGGLMYEIDITERV
jgi:hypothetical protein